MLTAKAIRQFSLTLTLAVSGSALFFPAAPASADEGVTKVYVYNGGADNKGTNDGFNSSSQGWIFQNMGLLGPNGEVPTVNGDDELVLPDGTVVGSVLRGDPDPDNPDEPGPIVGYENEDGSERAYNVDTEATTKDAWNACDANGQLIIAKHGVRYRNQQGEVTGTGITLDGGRAYGGLGEEDSTDGGTGAPDAPYGLPGREGANIGVYLNGCYTSHDADGDGDDKKSATDSAKDVPGVDDENVTGNPGIVWKGYRATVDTDAEIAALRDCAKAAGFTKKNDAGETVPDIGGWLLSLPFPVQRSTAVDCLTAAGIAPEDITLKIEYTKSPEEEEECDDVEDGSGGCNYYEPVTSIGPEGGFLFYNPSADHPMAQIEIMPLSLEAPTPLLIHPVVPTNEQLGMIPPDLELATWMFNVRRYDQDPLQLQGPALLIMEFDPADEIAGFGIMTENGPMPYPAQIDPAGFIVAEIFHDGTWFALKQVQPQGQVGDINLDGIVDVNDLLILLGSWGACPGCPADLNNDGVVDVNDLLELLANWS